MALRVNGKDIKDAIIKTDQFEMRILELTPDHLKVIVKETSGHPFNFVPRFFEMIYPERSIAAKDAGIVTVGTGKVVEAVVEFREKLRIETFLTMELRYARKRIAMITVE
ncbi:MAG: hypothetical protein AUG08_03200 [Acidobacteria bacterium 13_1_20CM_2_55_15]|nr:MAG: hypothetical protein AUH28_02580 [Acidobacteria bacterium 13_1_40CM_56_16]OLE89645.1 MAG: hypothetical protein AUG08_03200 [Acidobacteria bacterium 13_1_20CM_2_55_15]PYR72343.1 MAG: hypothetical protein DMG20_00180 [Acidobacteriota bacterium]